MLEHISFIPFIVFIFEQDPTYVVKSDDNATKMIYNWKIYFELKIALYSFYYNIYSSASFGGLRLSIVGLWKELKTHVVST